MDGVKTAWPGARCEGDTKWEVRCVDTSMLKHGFGKPGTYVSGRSCGV